MFQTYLYGYYDWLHGTWNTLWNQMSDLVLKAKKIVDYRKRLVFWAKIELYFLYVPAVNRLFRVYE